MSRITGIGSIRGISTFRNVPAAGGGGGGDVTPNAIDFPDLIYDGNCGVGVSRQITGISGSITISVSWNQLGGDYYYRVDNTEPVGETTGFSILTSDVQFSISNNQWLTIRNCTTLPDEIASIINHSDGNAVLDTFTWVNQSGGGS
jgi:hypothetical protein